MQIVRKKPTKVSVLSDSDDDIVEINRKDFTKAGASKKNESEKPREVISSSELFSKRPITRVEETKVRQKLQKLVIIIHKQKLIDQ